MHCTDKEKLNAVAESIKKAGYDPCDQIYGYFITGIDSYITRQGNAREIIKTIDKSVIAEYIKNNKKIL